jgi:hypothetical protein
MSDPTRLSEEKQARSALHAQTEEINRLERALAQQYGQESQSVAPVEEPSAPGDRLFSRKALFGWAFGTLFVVFIIRMVLPLVFATVKESVVDSMKQSMGITTVYSPALPHAGAAPAAPAVPATPATPPADAAPVVAPGTHPTATTVAPSTKPAATVVKIHKVEIKKPPR